MACQRPKGSEGIVNQDKRERGRGIRRQTMNHRRPSPEALGLGQKGMPIVAGALERHEQITGPE
jgi:hypothetical protein